jgi:hypothetical protein
VLLGAPCQGTYRRIVVSDALGPVDATLG